MTSESDGNQTDLFYDSLIHSYVDSPRFLHRDWLAARVDAAMAAADARFVLLTGEPGAGKTAFMAQLAADHPGWPRYFIRRDSQTPFQSGEARAFILALGHQLAARHPDLFLSEALAVTVRQQVDELQATGKVVGADVGELVLSPFQQTARFVVEQDVRHVSGELVGVAIRRVVAEASLLGANDLLGLALLAPARLLLAQEPEERIVVLVDALDELRYQAAAEDMVKWLASCPELPLNVRLVLASRPETMLDTFRRRQKPWLVEATIDPDSDSVRDDLRRYAIAFTGEDRVRQAVDAFDLDADDLVATWVDKADGNFQYLSALFKGIDAAGDDGERARLLGAAEVPEGLDGLYDFFLSLIRDDVADYDVEVPGSTSGQPGWEGLYQPLLGVLSVAREPLDAAQIRRLAGVRSAQRWVQAALDRLGQFLDVDGTRYRLYHASLPEFLTSEHTLDRYPRSYLDPVEWHQAIGEAYMGQAASWADVDWKNVDAYGVRHLPCHLAGAADGARLRELLLDYQWLGARLVDGDTNAVSADYDLVADDAELRSVRDALRLSSHVLDNDKTQLAGQLVGRLMDRPESAIQALLEQVADCRETPWLRPKTASLEAPGGTLERILAHHTDTVFAVALTPDAKRAVSASLDKTLVVWNMETRALEHVLAGHTGSVNALAVTPDGKRVVSGSSDREVKVWDLEAGGEDFTFRGHTDHVYAVAITPDGMRALSASWYTLKIWNLEKRVEERSLVTKVDRVNAMVVTPNGKYAICALSNRSVVAINLQTGLVEHELTGHTDSVDAVALTPDGIRAISASSDHTLRIWDLRDWSLERVLKGHTDSVTGVAITPDGKRAISTSHDLTVREWEIETGALKRILGRHAGWVHSIAVSHDGTRAISASSDRTVRIWNFQAQTPRSRLHSGPVDALALTSDERCVISASSDKTLKVWDIETASEKFSLTGHSAEVKHVVVTSDGSRAISGSRDTTLKVWNLHTGSEERSLAGHTGWVSALAVTPDGKSIVSGSYDRTIRMWDLENGKEVWHKRGHPQRICALVVTPDGKRVVSASADGSVIVWDLQNGAQIHSVASQIDREECLALTLDGGRAAVASREGILNLWNLHNGTREDLVAHEVGPITAVAVSRVGEQVVFAPADHPLHLWNPCSDTSTRTESMIGPASVVNGLMVTLDNRYVLAITSTGTLLVWSLQNRQIVASFTGDGPTLTCLYAPCGDTMVTGDASGRIHFLRVEQAGPT